MLCSLRSLLLAVIALSNCITWTASRHHFTHNVSGHRSRHRRQGTGLFLSASYVLPEGEGSGWGDWGAVSPCSRTCGGGVASQKRICLQFGSDGQPQCTGGDTKYISCETQDCPAGAEDFRTTQCAYYNNESFRGIKYKWEPYTKAPNPCELNCMPHGERFYYRHKSKVVDGTRCNDDSFDVCVNGTCQPVGCDMMLGSNAREDKCRNCRGNGVNCHTTSGLLNTQDLRKGYNDMLLIPEGATSIYVMEVRPSNNYLALRAKNGTYYLNGDYHIDFPRSMVIAGAIWYYERSQQGFAAPDKLRCLGPTNEPLYLSLLLQDDNVGIEYEYSLPSELAPRPTKKYNWVHDNFTPCSVTCAGGFQTRNVTCRSSEELVIVDDGLCDEGLKPPTNQTCNTQACAAQWVEGPWSQCSKRCGKGGTRSREIRCEKIITSGFPSIVSDKECFDILGPKPELYQECNVNASCPTWFAGLWKPCNKLCGEGKQTRQVVCYQKNAGRIEVLGDDECIDEKPPVEQSCTLQLCDGVDWVLTDWSGCDTCLSTISTRVALCATKDHKVVNSSYCEYHPTPVLQKPCDVIPPCQVQWYATQWSKCSVECGKGVQTRQVFCGRFENEAVVIVNDSLCADLPKYNDTKPCEVPKEKCPSKWYASPWTACTKECGGGEQHRRVMCLRGNKPASDCSLDLVLDSSQICNDGPCNKDEMLPLNPNSTPIMDDDMEDCINEDDYPEVGLDIATPDFKSTLGGKMFSDGPTIEEGSGMEFPVSIDLDSTVSFDDTGSGFELTSSIEDKLSVEGLTRETSDTSDTDTTETTDVNTFTTESTVTEENLTTDSNTTDTDYDSTDYSTTNDTSEATSETGSTESSETDETSLSGSSSSTQTDETSESPTATGSGSTETLITEVKHSKKKTTLTSKSLITSDRGETKKTTVSAPTNESTVIYSSKETLETESTTSSITDETGSTSSTETDETSDFTTETGSDVTETSVTDVTDLEENTTLSSKSLITSDREETKKTTVPPPTNESTVIDSSTETSETESTASSITDETGSTSSTETDETSDLTTETESDVTDITEVTDLKKKVTALSSESAITPDRDETKKTTVPPPTNESTVIYSIKETTETESTASSITDETGSTSSTETDETSDFTTETGSDVTEKSITEVTDLSTLSSESVTTSDKDVTTKSTISPPTKESTVFDSSEESSETDTTASSITDETGSTLATKSDETSELGDTQSTTETESNATEPSATTTIIDMKSSKFGSSEMSSITESTESTVRNETEPITTEKSTELKLTDETSEASPTLSSIAKVTEETVSSTTESSPGKSAETKEESKETSSTTEVSIVNATSSEKTSRSVPMEETTESVSGSTEPLTEKTTESSFVTATSSEKTSRSVSTEETTESVSGSTEPLTEKTTEAEAKSIEPNSTIETSTVAATTMETGSSSEVTQSTISELFTSEEASETASTVSLFSESVSSTIESSSTSSLEETTESTASSSSSESTSEFTEATTLPTEISGEGRTEQTSPTTEGTTLPTQTQETSETTSGAPVQGSSEKTTEVLPTEVTPVGTTIRDWKITMLITKPICKKRKVHCSKSKFGCCPDRKTAAAGPFDEGCPKPETCKESHYGCCPDEISPALGSKYEGCPIMPCAESLFGCCLSDNKSSAEGNDQEGCPPKPPACKSTEYGCCDDGETKATGPGNLGCPEYSTITQTNADTETTSQKETVVTETSSTLAEGCAGTAFGCCFDNETEALGPDGQGCPCNVTTFGCCPDGVSPANGTQMEGCLASCNTSSFGCCPDGKTPAHGHGQEGCCLLYPFGCCPDNYKPAEGPHLEGCGCQYARFGCCPDNVTYARGPNNEGCGCQYSTHGCCPDRHTEASGPSFEGCGCHTYQFGCCPDGFTIAKGTGLRGCHCHESKYGCCGDGETAASGPEKQGCDCSSSKYGCCPDGITEAKGSKFLGCTDIPLNRQAACSLSTDRGSCRNYSVHWYYDLEYGGCSRFWYGGCEGNGNRFTSKEECEDVCVQPSPQDTCKLPKVKGACTGYNVRWYYDNEREQCSQFVFGGCLGNANNFDSRELCQTQCEPTKTADQCNLPIDRGSCSGNFGRWGFNAETRRCEQFIWGGCEGNSNRFGSEAACVQRCDPPGTPKPQCTQPQDVGNCTDKEAMWSFSQSENRCVPFYYTGCGGNDNRFDNEQNCIDACPSSYIPDLCTLPSETGDCANYRERWYFDTSEERCRQFYYGGCGGNSNNFGSQIECENRCTDFTPTTTTVQPPELRSHEAENISASCLLEKDPGPCTQMSTRWAYDYTIGKCAHFQYGGCGGNVNNFPSEETCEYYCKPVQDICQLPMLSGPCDDSIMRWFYDASIDACNQFTYGGCQGNDNRFETRDDCERRCRSGPPASEAQTTTSTTTSASSTTVKVNIQNRLKEGKAPKACTISSELEECTRAGMVWYYDAERFECVAYENNETGKVCRHTGVFSSEEACQRSCGAFRNINVCRYSLDPGPCQNFVSKYYFNQTSGICHEFAYGGCHGGPNRFSSFDECLQVCRPEMDPCKQGAEPGNCQTRFEMWYYDYYSDSCSRFTYTGCGGNDNRFETREDCEGRCRQRPAVITTTTTTIEVAHTTTTTVAPTYTVEPKAAECLTPDSLTPCGMNITAFYYDSARKVCVESDIGACRYSNSYRSEEECERKCGAFKDINVCEARLDTGPCRNSISKFYWDFASGRCQPYAYGGCGGGANRFSTIEECEEVCGSTGPESPRVNLETEPEVTGTEGGKAVLRCLFHGNPPPKITWTRGEITDYPPTARRKSIFNHSFRCLRFHLRANPKHIIRVQPLFSSKGNSIY